MCAPPIPRDFSPPVPHPISISLPVHIPRPRVAAEEGLVADVRCVPVVGTDDAVVDGA